MPASTPEQLAGDWVFTGDLAGRLGKSSGGLGGGWQLAAAVVSPASGQPAIKEPKVA